MIKMSEKTAVLSSTDSLSTSLETVSATVRLSSGICVKIPTTPSDSADDEKQRKKALNTVFVEKVTNVWGSTAGAGSDFFDIYRKHRYTEMDRLEKMEKDWREKVENEEFQRRREEKILEDVKLVQKRAEKRKRKKEMIKQRQRLAKIKKKTHHSIDTDVVRGKKNTCTTDSEKSSFSEEEIGIKNKQVKSTQKDNTLKFFKRLPTATQPPTKSDFNLISKNNSLIRKGDALVSSCSSFSSFSESTPGAMPKVPPALTEVSRFSSTEPGKQEQNNNDEIFRESEEKINAQASAAKEEYAANEISAEIIKNRVNLIIRDADEELFC